MTRFSLVPSTAVDPEKKHPIHVTCYGRYYGFRARPYCYGRVEKRNILKFMCSNMFCYGKGRRSYTIGLETTSGRTVELVDWRPFKYALHRISSVRPPGPDVNSWIAVRGTLYSVCMLLLTFARSCCPVKH